MNLRLPIELTFWIRCEECDNEVMDIVVNDDMRGYKTLVCPKCEKKVAFNFHLQVKKT